jgi:amino acid transporter, AAT family
MRPSRMSSIHPRALVMAARRASRVSAFIVGFTQGAWMMPFTAAKLGAVGVSAGETENPETVLPHAINSVVSWMLVLYTGALLIIMSLVPWNQLSPDTSPFVLVFEKIGIPAGAGLINFVVITAAASSCNSGIFSTGRMLYSLAKVRHAPRAFGNVSRRNVPAAGIAASAAIMLIGVALNYIVPEQVFVYVTSVSLVGALWTWALIVIAHLGYRKAVAIGKTRPVAYRMPGSPYTNWFAVAFLVLVAMLLSLDKGTRVALYIATGWFALLGIGYQVGKPRAA